MPKLKTRKSISKRVRVTKKKKVMRSKAGRRHLMSGKDAKRKRGLRKKTNVACGNKKTMKRAMPYS